MKLSNQNNIQLSIKRIKELSFSVNEMLFAQKQNQHQGEVLKVEIALHLSFAIETNLIFVLVRVYYHFPDSPNDIFTEIEVQNIFEIPDLKRFQVGDSEIVLPPDIITSIVDLSISHTRALFAKNISGTILQENVIGIIDPTKIAEHFFPKMFGKGSLIMGK